MVHSHKAPFKTSGQWLWLGLLLVAVALKQIVLLVIIPPWQVPDEPAHFQYVQTLVEEHRAPVFSAKKRDVSAELRQSFYRIQTQIKGPGKEHFPPTTYPVYPRIPVRQSAPDGQSPRNLAGTYGPVYYLTATVPYYLFYSAPIETRLRAVRVLSSITLLVVVWLAYRIGYRLRGRGFGLALGTIIGFLPMLGYVSAGVNNDIFLLLFSALAFDRVSRGLVGTCTWRDLVWLGMWVGLAAMTKQQGWVLVGSVAVALFLQRHQLGWSKVRKYFGIFLSIAIPLGISWSIRGFFSNESNFIFGNDLVAKNISASVESLRHSQILVQYIFSRWPTVFVSFWGFFGWNGFATHFPWTVYKAIGVLVPVVCIGGVYAWRRLAGTPIGQWFRVSVVTWAGLEFVFSVTFWQRAMRYGADGLSFPNQGRYYFFLLIPIVSTALLAAEFVLPSRFRTWTWAGVAVGMVGLCAWSIWPLMTTLYQRVI